MRAGRGFAALLIASLGACAADGIPVPDEPPIAGGGKADSEFTVDGAHTWYLVGDALTPGNDTLDLTVTGPASASVVDLWIDHDHAARATRTSAGWTLSADISALPPGDHTALLAADGDHDAFARIDFKRSHPLYVAVSNDWDTGDHSDDKLERQDRLHANHPQLVITHFVGPYTFTDPSVSASRAQYLVDWLKHYRDTKGDEIGLHVHPYCNFVTTAGVTCRTSPSFSQASDASGYSVIVASYTRAELAKIFARAVALFEQHGLGHPTSFRAGGWTATLDVLDALGGAGFLVDASGANWRTLEEWQYEPGAQIYQWNQMNWVTINATSQPYYPSTTDLLESTAPTLDVLEVPDNGSLVDYVSADEMIANFEANYTAGSALTETKHYSIGYHPVDFSEAFFTRIDTALTQIDKHLAAIDAGPVIYARMSDLPRAFPQP